MWEIDTYPNIVYHFIMLIIVYHLLSWCYHFLGLEDVWINNDKHNKQ